MSSGSASSVRQLSRPEHEVPLVASIFSEVDIVDGVVLHFQLKGTPCADGCPLDRLEGKVQYAGKSVALCTAHIIHRSRIQRHEFRDSWCSCNLHPDFDVSYFGCLFNNFGQLKREYIDHEIKSVAGVWGTELDEGAILRIDSISCEPSWRRKGLGRKLVFKMMEMTRTRVSVGIQLFMFAVPHSVPQIVQRDMPPDPPESQAEDLEREHQIVAHNFFRQLGFRRVGDSPWFAHAHMDLVTPHPSRQIAAAQDYDPPPRQKIA